jgi:hypothetical protein
MDLSTFLSMVLDIESKQGKPPHPMCGDPFHQPVFQTEKRLYDGIHQNRTLS